MTDEEKILITYSTMHETTDIKINCTTNEAFYEDEKVDVDIRSFKHRLFEIVNLWDEEMINDNILDGISYSVSIQIHGKLISYHGRNKFPVNFKKFQRLIDEVKNAKKI